MADRPLRFSRLIAYNETRFLPSFRLCFSVLLSVLLQRLPPQLTLNSMLTRFNYHQRRLSLIHEVWVGL